MVTWIAWERFYFDAEISWPWLVLGNSFARSIGSIQWYEFTGTLGGSLWIWTTNLSIFGLLVSLSDGSWNQFNIKAKSAILAGIPALIAIPFIVSSIIGKQYTDSMKSNDQLETLIIQPNIDPYNKFEFLSQSQQNDILLSQVDSAIGFRKNDSTAAPLLIVVS